MKEDYIITINRPAEVSVADLRAYIKDAVECWNKGGDPESPLWEINKCAVRRATFTLKSPKK